MNIIEEKLNSFKQNAEATSATVQFVQNAAFEISEAVKVLVNPFNTALVSVNERDLIEPFLKSINPIFQPSQEEIVTTKICITDSCLGIAETGSILISSDSQYAAYFSMLTETHIVLIHASDIYDKPRDIFNNKEVSLNNCESFSIITGPSATADMGSLVRGVHGPKNLHIIVIM